MTAFGLRGWCPDAWRPMMAGDGLIVRVKPRLARLTRPQVEALADLAGRFGSGAVDLTNRANLQIRGVREEGWRELLAVLVDTGLVDEDPEAEGRRNVLVAPGWEPGDETARIAEALLARLSELPRLPGKMGLAVDAGATAVLTACPADFRIERAESGGLLIRLDGRESGAFLDAEEAADRVLDLAQWFIDSGGIAAGRASRHVAPLPAWAAGESRPARTSLRCDPGYGVAFGRIAATALVELMDATGAAALRITPWRRVHPESCLAPPVAGFILGGDDPLLRTDACPGAPDCPSSSVETRQLAARLAPHISGRLHVSGCAKGCARSRPSDVTLTGRDGAFDLAFGARAGDPPAHAGLTAEHLIAHFGAS